MRGERRRWVRGVVASLVLHSVVAMVAWRVVRGQRRAPHVPPSSPVIELAIEEAPARPETWLAPEPDAQRPVEERTPARRTSRSRPVRSKDGLVTRTPAPDAPAAPVAGAPAASGADLMRMRPEGGPAVTLEQLLAVPEPPALSPSDATAAVLRGDTLASQDAWRSRKRRLDERGRSAKSARTASQGLRIPCCSTTSATRALGSGSTRRRWGR